jgi:hypothetical protein
MPVPTGAGTIGENGSDVPVPLEGLDHADSRLDTSSRRDLSFHICWISYTDGKAKLKDAQPDVRRACGEPGSLRGSAAWTPSDLSAACAACEVVGHFPIGAANWGSSEVRGVIGNAPERPGQPRKSLRLTLCCSATSSATRFAPSLSPPTTAHQQSYRSPAPPMTSACCRAANSIRIVSPYWLTPWRKLERRASWWLTCVLPPHVRGCHIVDLCLGLS